MSSSLFSAQLHPGRALGFLVLGASLHDVLTRIKAEPQRFPKIELYFNPSSPVTKEVVVGLPANGLRLQFDGPEQRLRLIEVINFTKNHIFFKPANDKERDLVRPPSDSPTTDSTPEPTFRHIYQRFLGPTYGGEFVKQAGDAGLYILSYPGVGFVFPMKASEYSPEKDVVSLLSSSAVPKSMAVFSGDSWAQARKTMWTEVLPSIKTFAPLSKGKDVCPDEVSLVKIHGGGKVQLFRKWSNNSFSINFGETTPQQIVAELGPPDAIYRKNDQRMYIHKLRAASNTAGRPNGKDLNPHDDMTDTDQSSLNPSDGYGSNEDEEAVEDEIANVAGECFYNYFYLGFDILVSTPTEPSEPPPSSSSKPTSEPPFRSTNPNRQVATKLILHGNVPGSYPFNRHRRCRWEIAYLAQGNIEDADDTVPNSETPFSELEAKLKEEWKSIYASESEAQQKQRGMVLNRGWGDSPGSSIEMLGGWEDPGAGVGRKFEGSEESTTTLYGYPGLVFEVLRSGAVSAVTVF
ncbi:hypothetical protein QBC40DRAFT_273726 [Triangularia verruculosa]|uniref:Uncharacterized protein n=1 Tax=Triangularia verruculosa TaxID=2587418 RepID=A0AAN6XRA9_9PEZI|nr:hypothetical protein QBC40DRAFT_273726 [Triangularia verruculosa]